MTLEQKVDKLANEKLNALLSNCDLNLIVTLDKSKGMVYVGGQRVEEAQLASLKAEAEAIHQFGIWKLMYETPKALAERAMFVDSDSLDGLKKGRSILYTLSTQKNILDLFKNYVSKPKPIIKNKNVV